MANNGIWCLRDCGLVAWCVVSVTSGPVKFASGVGRVRLCGSVKCSTLNFAVYLEFPDWAVEIGTCVSGPLNVNSDLGNPGVQNIVYKFL